MSSITEKILQDARQNARKIKYQADKEVQDMQKKAQDYEQMVMQKTHEEAKAKEREIKEVASIDFEVQKSKAMLAEKQGIILKLKKSAKQNIYNATKKEKLNFIKKILSSNASKGETVEVKLKDIDVKDVASLGIVKKLKLKVRKGKKDGIVLVSDFYDDSFLIDDLIDEAYSKNLDKIVKVLFG